MVVIVIFINVHDILHQFSSVTGDSFINVGPYFTSQLPTTGVHPARFIDDSFPSSFMFRSICTHEVTGLNNTLNVNKSFIGVTVLCLKMASSLIS